MSQSDRIDVGLYKKNPIFLQRYANLFFMDSNSTSVRPVKLEDRHINQKCIEDVLRLSQLQKRGKFPLDEVWGGSQWWSMSRTTVQAIVNELSSNLWLRESFEYSAIPDEMVFQTLYARLKNLSTRSFTSPMFTDMTKYPRPYVYKAISEFPEIPLGKLFVRKIDNSNALSVMEQIKHFWKSTK
jgi:hypothetical protein